MPNVVKIFRPSGQKITLDLFGYFVYQTETWDVNADSYLYKKWQGKNLLFHRKLMWATDREVVDHVNRDTLDNRRSNLRFCTKGQNAVNTAPLFGRTSKGVRERCGSWTATIHINSRSKHLGTFKTRQEAMLAYNDAAVAEYGEFAWLNSV